MNPSASKRLIELDVARAIAIYFMMIINFKLVFHHDDGYYPLLTALANHLDGRAAATFVVLAGIGVSCLRQRMFAAASARRRLDVMTVLLKRSLFLLATGAAFTLAWPCDILHVYGVLLMAGALTIPWSERQLLAMSMILWPLFFGIMVLADYDLLWTNQGLPIHEMKTFPILFKHYLFNGTYPLIPWLIFFASGLWFGGRYIHLPWKAGRLVLFGLAATGTAEVASYMLFKLNAAKYFSSNLDHIIIINDTALNPALNWFVVRAFPPSPLFVVSALGTAMVVIGASRYLVRQWPQSQPIHLLVNTGRMSLSIYVGHILFSINTMEFFGINGDQHIVFVIACATLTFLCFLLLAQTFKRHALRGPLEWLMRKVSDASWTDSIKRVLRKFHGFGNFFTSRAEIPLKVDAPPPLKHIST